MIPEGYSGVHVRAAIEWGEIEVCRTVRESWQVFGGGQRKLVPITFSGYDPDDATHLGDVRQMWYFPYDDAANETFRFSPDDGLPLSECGA